MNCLGIFAIMLTVLSSARATQETQGHCSCAVFSKSSVTERLIEHSLPLNVTCDEEGSGKCLQLCLALAAGAKERVPELICEKLDRHVENLMVALHSKACSSGNWRFTGLEGSQGICCHEGKETPCETLPSE